MASSWAVSPDRRTYTWHLDPRITWSDGRPLTAYDWLWTFERLIDPRNGFAERERVVASIARVEAPASHRLVVQVTQPLAVGLELASLPTPLPRHVWERYDPRDTSNPEIQSPSVTSGPFRLRSRIPGTATTFVANEHYWRGRPLIDELRFQVLPDKLTGYDMMKRGELDWGSRLVQPSALQEGLAHPLLQVYEWDPANPTWHSISFNLRRPWLDDIGVRRAIAYASDREAIRPFFNGLAKPTYSTYAPPSWAYNPDVPRYEHDLEQAARELDQAGWTLEPGSRVRSRDGQPLELRLLFALPAAQSPMASSGHDVCEVCQPSGAHALTAQRTQQALGELGVRVSVEGLEPQRFDQVMKRPPHDWDLAVLGLGTTVDPHWTGPLWTGSAGPGANRGAYNNPRVDKLYAQAALEPDRERRRQLYGEIQQIVATDLPSVFLAYNIDCMFLNKRVHPNPPTRLGLSYAPEHWWLEA
jgi:peptide/nickel transport system substrate-binding protein